MAAAVLPSAAPARVLETVLQDDAQLLHRPEAQLRRSLEELRLLGVNRIRVTAGWSVLAPEPDAREKPPFDATNPVAYEQARWRNLDRLIVLAHEYGFRTMVDIAFWAPKWASADGQGERGRTNVDPALFADFSKAVARRYSGTFIIQRPAGPGARPIIGSDERYLGREYGSTNAAQAASGTPFDVFGRPLLLRDGGEPGGLEESLGGEGSAAKRPLPRVDVFTLWNEPNHTGFLRPQWVKVGSEWHPRSPHVYRAMVAAAYPAIKSMRPDATVLVGGTAYNGSYSGLGRGGVPPLRFLRELACVDARFRPLERDGCEAFAAIPGDGWAHHPYSLETEPGATNPPSRPDDVPVAELPRLASTLDRLVRMGRLSPALRQLWVTEYGYETNPPVRDHKFTPRDQAQFLPWAEYLAWKVPSVRSYAQFLLRDLPPSTMRVGTSKKRAFGQWQSGLLFDDGRIKEGFEAFRAGIVVERVRSGRLRFWLRLRLGEGARQVVLETRRPGIKDFSPIRTLGIGGKTPELAFSAPGNSVAQRFGRVGVDRQRTYRLRYSDGGGWKTTPAVRSIDTLL